MQRANRDRFQRTLIFAGKQLLRPYLDEFKKNSSDAELKRITKLKYTLKVDFKVSFVVDFTQIFEMEVLS